MKAQLIILDPSDVREAVLQGIELKGDAELKEFFDDIVSRGKKRSADKKRKAALVVLGP